jgi:hypothetical protein
MPLNYSDFDYGLMEEYFKERNKTLSSKNRLNYFSSLSTLMFPRSILRHKGVVSERVLIINRKT